MMELKGVEPFFVHKFFIKSLENRNVNHVYPLHGSTNIQSHHRKFHLEIRIIYSFHKNNIILLHAFIKKTHQIPKRHILIANQRLNSLDH